MFLLHISCILRRPRMLPAWRTNGEGFTIPTFDLVPSDVEGFMDALWEFQSAFHDCFARSEPRAHFFDYMVGQFSNSHSAPRKRVIKRIFLLAFGARRGHNQGRIDTTKTEQAARVPWESAPCRSHYPPSRSTLSTICRLSRLTPTNSALSA